MRNPLYRYLKSNEDVLASAAYRGIFQPDITWSKQTGLFHSHKPTKTKNTKEYLVIHLQEEMVNALRKCIAEDPDCKGIFLRDDPDVAPHVTVFNDKEFVSPTKTIRGEKSQTPTECHITLNIQFSGENYALNYYFSKGRDIGPNFKNAVRDRKRSTDPDLDLYLQGLLSKALRSGDSPVFDAVITAVTRLWDLAIVEQRTLSSASVKSTEEVVKPLVGVEENAELREYLTFYVAIAQLPKSTALPAFEELWDSCNPNTSFAEMLDREPKPEKPIKEGDKRAMYECIQNKFLHTLERYLRINGKEEAEIQDILRHHRDSVFRNWESLPQFIDPTLERGYPIDFPKMKKSFRPS